MDVDNVINDRVHLFGVPCIVSAISNINYCFASSQGQFADDGGDLGDLRTSGSP